METPVNISSLEEMPIMQGFADLFASISTSSRVIGTEIKRTTTVSTLLAYPYCCGAGILCGLTGMTGSELQCQIKDAQEQNYGMLLAICNHRQNGPVGRLLEKKGFKMVFSGTNPRHHGKTICFLYVLDLTQDDLAFKTKKKTLKLE